MSETGFDQEQGAGPTPAASPARGLVRLAGNVRSAAGRPIPGAVVRLVGGADTLGGYPAAAMHEPMAVTWSRPLGGFAGSARTCWRRYVSPQAAGITWAEFRQQARLHNPALAETGGRFEAGRSYLLPENGPAGANAIVWDRALTGFAGTLYACWQRFVAHKVAGCNYLTFKQAFGDHNPAYRAGDRALQAGKAYLLPRNAGQAEYGLYTTTNRRGRFHFPRVPAGKYQLLASAPYCEPSAQALDLTGPLDLVVTLQASRAAPPAGAEPAPARPFVQVTGDEFFLNDRPFRFVGVNIRGLVHYGDRQTLEHTVPAHQVAQLQAASAMGARVARVFLPSQYRPADEVAARLRALLDLIARDYPGIYVLPAFTDLYGASPFHTLGDDGYYEDGLLRKHFFGGGYRDHYLPFVEKIVPAFRDEPRIFAWEVGNEIKLDRANPNDENDPNPRLFIQFVHDVAGRIRQLDANHLITTGMISTRHAWLFTPDLKRELYDTPCLDFITIHAYFWNDGGVQKQEDDSPVAAALHKPFIVEEAGFDSAGVPDRSELVGEDLERWFNRGARGYMQWGFMATEDMGDGDRSVGMDRIFHRDWDGLFSRYQGRARSCEQFAASWTPGTTVGGPAESFAKGQTVYAYDQVRVRRSPGRTNKPDGDILGAVNPGAALTVLGPARPADDLTWWPVRAPLADGQTVEGWCAQATAEQVLLGAQPLAPQ